MKLRCRNFFFQGLVFVNGANVIDANDSKSLYDIFEKGSENRHVASTSELLSGRNFEGVKFLCDVLDSISKSLYQSY